MVGGVTHHMLPRLPGVPHLYVNRPLIRTLSKAPLCPVLTEFDSVSWNFSLGFVKRKKILKEGKKLAVSWYIVISRK